MMEIKPELLAWYEEAYDKLVYQWRNTHMTLSIALDIDFDPEGDDARYEETINFLKVAAETAQAETVALRKQVAELAIVYKYVVDLDMQSEMLEMLQQDTGDDLTGWGELYSALSELRALEVEAQE